MYLLFNLLHISFIIYIHFPMEKFIYINSLLVFAVFIIWCDGGLYYTQERVSWKNVL